MVLCQQILGFLLQYSFPFKLCITAWLVFHWFVSTAIVCPLILACIPFINSLHTAVITMDFSPSGVTEMTMAINWLLGCARTNRRTLNAEISLTFQPSERWNDHLAAPFSIHVLHCDATGSQPFYNCLKLCLIKLSIQSTWAIIFYLLIFLCAFLIILTTWAMWKVRDCVQAARLS